MRANVICPGFVRTPLVDRQIPEQAKALGISEEQVVKSLMLKDTVDGEFTTIEDVAEAAVFFAGFHTNALTGQSLIVSTAGRCSEEADWLDPTSMFSGRFRGLIMFALIRIAYICLVAFCGSGVFADTHQVGVCRA